MYNTGSKVCGNAGWKDRTKFIRITIDHVDPILILKFKSNLNEASTNESFGFNILDIIYCDSGDECISSDHVSDFTDGSNKLELVRDDAEIQTDWTSNLAEGDWTTTCDNKKILGGYDKAGKNTYFERLIKFPVHKKVTIAFTIFALDSWDNEFFFVYADGT